MFTLQWVNAWVLRRSLSVFLSASLWIGSFLEAWHSLLISLLCGISSLAFAWPQRPLCLIALVPLLQLCGFLPEFGEGAKVGSRGEREVLWQLHQPLPVTWNIPCRLSRLFLLENTLCCSSYSNVTVRGYSGAVGIWSAHDLNELWQLCVVWNWAEAFSLKCYRLFFFGECQVFLENASKIRWYI